MKKALSFAVALGLVAGMASYAAAADVDFHGDARWRGVSINDTDADESTMDGKDGMDQRYRLVANINVNEDLMVGTRLNLRDGSFTGANVSSQVIVDRAYMKIKMLGGTYLIGRQNASWGNKFLGWGNGVDRIKAVYKNGDLTYGGYYQKDAENTTLVQVDAFGNTAGYANNDDKDTYAAFLIGKAGDSKYGVLLNYKINHGAVDPTPEDGQLIDVFFNTKAGTVNIMTEFVYKAGDMFESAAGDSPMGLFVGAQTKIDAVNIKAIAAFYANNEGDAGGSRDCDNDFAPTVLIGTCQETALLDFGGSTADGNVLSATHVNGTGVANDSDDSTYLIGGGADLKINDKLTVGAGLYYAQLSDVSDVEMLEFDVTASYVLAKGVTYKLSAAYADLSLPAGVVTDEIIAFGNSISVKW